MLLFENLFARGGSDIGVAAHDARDRRGGDAGLPGDVVYGDFSGHFLNLSCV